MNRKNIRLIENMLNNESFFWDFQNLEVRLGKLFEAVHVLEMFRKDLSKRREKIKRAIENLPARGKTESLGEYTKRTKEFQKEFRSEYILGDHLWDPHKDSLEEAEKGFGFKTIKDITTVEQVNTLLEELAQIISKTKDEFRIVKKRVPDKKNILHIKQQIAWLGSPEQLNKLYEELSFSDDTHSAIIMIDRNSFFKIFTGMNSEEQKVKWNGSNSQFVFFFEQLRIHKLIWNEQFRTSFSNHFIHRVDEQNEWGPFSTFALEKAAHERKKNKDYIKDPSLKRIREAIRKTESVI